ncbi:MAG: MFS transporter [Coriobacteriales bacterium]|jgi:MFS family permease|nr:MFS transporter [Coriobacteriales bacterium]
MDAQKRELVNLFAMASPSKKRLTLIGIYLAALITRFISTGTFTLLPMAALDIGGMDIYPLVSSVGGAMSICIMPIYGFLGAGNPALKRPLLAGSLTLGAAIFTAISFAPNMFVIIAVNFFYGAVSASIFVVAYSMIRDMYNARQAAIYLGFIGTVTSIGMFIGPTIIGLITDTLGWRVAYRISVPLLLLAVLFIMIGVKVTRAQAAPHLKGKVGFDALGAFSLTLLLLGLVMTLSLGTTYVPFGSPLSHALILVAMVGFVMLLVDFSKKREQAFIPLAMLKDRNTVALALYNFFINTSANALVFFMPAYIISVLDGGGLYAAFSTAIYAVPGIFISPFLGKLIVRQGSARGLITVGTLVRIVVTIAVIIILSPQTPLPIVYVLMFIAGLYSAQQNVTSSTAPQIQIKPELRFQANSLVQTAQNLGSSIGMAVYTLIMASFGITQGMNVALVIATAIAVIALVMGQFLVKSKPQA